MTFGSFGLLRTNSMKKLVLYSVVLLSIFGCKPKIKVIHHDENMAANSALEFAKVAFVQQDYTKAYYLLSQNGKMPFQKFNNVIREIHPNGFPTTVKTTEYEPMPGQEAMSIFLYGERTDEKFYYRVVMQGTKKTNYKVFAFYQGNGPYPQSKLRKSLKAVVPAKEP